MVKSAFSVVLIAGTLLLPACSDSSSPACVRNSECASGNYCSADSCTSDCTTATVADDCATGEMCSSFGMCVAPPDGGQPDLGQDDLGVLPVDAGVDAPPDMRPACVIVGGVDVDGDGYCVDSPTDADCADENDAVHPGAAEICTPSTTGSVSMDENCDAAIDETCDWHFGPAHPVPAIYRGYIPTTRTNPNGSIVAGDGHLYVEYSPATLGGFNVVRFDRAGRGAEFGAPVPVAFDPGFAPIEFALLRDELSGVGGGGPTPADRDLYELRRTTLTAPFSATRIDALSTPAREAHTTLSPDGLELLFLRDSVLYRSERASVSVGFTAAAIVEGLPSPMSYPQLTDDGAVLVYAYAPTGRSATLWRATRNTTDRTRFDAPVELAELNPGGVHELNHPHVSLATREIFFSTASLATGGMARMLFRAELCLDGPCGRREIDCPSPGLRSADGLHCFRAGSASAGWAVARTGCTMLGAGWHLATFQSNEERAALWTDYGRLGNFWVGGSDVTTEGTWAWSNSEPWVYAGWGPTQPDDAGGAEDCAALWTTTVPPGGLNDFMCSNTVEYVCESEMWPTW